MLNNDRAPLDDRNIFPNHVFYSFDCLSFQLFNKFNTFTSCSLGMKNLSDLLPGAMLHILQGPTRFNVSIINSGLAWEGLSSMVFFGMLVTMGHGF